MVLPLQRRCSRRKVAMDMGMQTPMEMSAMDTLTIVDTMSMEIPTTEGRTMGMMPVVTKSMGIPTQLAMQRSLKGDTPMEGMAMSMKQR
mmetsp:Transcript_27328/g.62998  ORF Transcript_27328/g.62998 Transcript_27328/m.62998 type:complete len:89 (+) Transcript_27328:74-340(+)